LKRVFLALAALIFAGTLWAHHSTSAVFDESKRVIYTGTLTKVDWINPHIVLEMTVTSGDAKGESWKLESHPPSWYRRVGVGKADFADGIGQPITVEGWPSRDGSKYLYMLKVKFPDGHSMELASPDTKNP
jgi:hypothetical protein